MSRIRFDEFIERALYEPTHGFYTTSGSAGRRSDFITSPEVGPLFGAVVARALDAWWLELGEPDPFVVVEGGAGVGTLAVSIRAAGPRCSDALRYVLVERSDRLRRHHGDHLPVVDLRNPCYASDSNGALFISRPTIPIEGEIHVVLANELLDNLAFRLVERRDSGWWEIWAEPVMGESSFRESLFEADDEVVALVEHLVPIAPDGSRIAIQEQACAWVSDALSRIKRGRLVVIDYATTSSMMVKLPWTKWVRTYRAHGRGGDPFEMVGMQDITCDVAVDQLSLVRPPTSDRSQAEFLVEHGIDRLVEEGRRIWDERAHIGDLVALKARSRVVEEAALCDPAGLGAFRVLEWVI